MKSRIRVALILLAALLVVQGALADVVSRPEITGAGAAVQIATTGNAHWVLIVADPGNTAAVRVGDATVSSTSGARVAPGGGLFLPFGPGYHLANIYVYVAASDKVSVLWAN
jgi:hypothetical protein